MTGEIRSGNTGHEERIGRRPQELDLLFDSVPEQVFTLYLILIPMFPKGNR
jgi:hypothetical protein